MKRRHLTIFLFSTMMLVAAPKATSHFNRYSTALHQQVETEWLRFLLSIGTPVESDAPAIAQNDVQQPTPCSSHSDDAIVPTTARTRTEAPVISRQRKQRVRSFEFTFGDLNALLKLTNGIAPKEFKFKLDNGAHGIWNKVPLVSPAAANHDEPVAANYARALARLSKQRERRAMRLLSKATSEMRFEKSIPVVMERVRFEESRTYAPAAPEAPAVPAITESVEPEATDCSNSVEEGAR